MLSMLRMFSTVMLGERGSTRYAVQSSHACIGSAKKNNQRMNGKTFEGACAAPFKTVASMLHKLLSPTPYSSTAAPPTRALTPATSILSRQPASICFSLAIACNGSSSNPSSCAQLYSA